MHKKDFYKQIANQLQIEESTVTKVMDTALNALESNLKSGEKVVLTGFGSFEKRQSAARQGVNPATGEKIQIAARNRVAFTAGKRLKDSVNS